MLKDVLSNVKNMLGNPGDDCWNYLQGIINKLGLSNLKSPSDFLTALNSATWDVMGDQNGTFTDGPAKFGQNGSIWAETTTSGILGTGQINEVVFGWKFFNSDTMTPTSVLTHEGFHLAAGGIMILGVNINGLSDPTLFKAAGVTTAEDFNHAIDDHCK